MSRRSSTWITALLLTCLACTDDPPSNDESASSESGDHGDLVVNEPGWGSVNDIQQWKLDVFTPFHEQMIEHLHELAPELLIVYDNPGIDAMWLSDNIVHPRPTGDFLIYGPHLYGAAIYGPGKANSGEAIAEMAEFGRSEDVHVLFGEFGFQPHESAGPEWLTHVSEALERERISATLWEVTLHFER